MTIKLITLIILNLSLVIPLVLICNKRSFTFIFIYIILSITVPVILSINNSAYLNSLTTAMTLINILLFTFMHIIAFIYPWTNRERMRALKDEIDRNAIDTNQFSGTLHKEINLLKTQVNNLHDFLKKEGIKLPSNLE